MSLDELIALLLIFISGAFVGGLALWLFVKVRRGSLKQIAREIITAAEHEAALRLKESELKIKQREEECVRIAEKALLERKNKLASAEERLKEREDKMEHRFGLVEKKLVDIERREALLAARKEKNDAERKRLEAWAAELEKERQQLASLSREQAKELILESVRKESRLETARLIQDALDEAKAEGETLAKDIIITAIERISLQTVSEVSQVVVTLPNDEMKGRIVGRDGRNIRSLERATGVNFLIDESPGTIIISGYDPVRKMIAKQALSELVQDGRIHPTRIEEAAANAKVIVQKQIRKAGEDAALRAGIIDLHPELQELLGKLKYRHSFGQNVLEHSLEVAHLMGLMAAELGLNVERAKRIGLLHDIGKAVTHETEGTHALIGRDLALKYDESPFVANGIGCHHGEIAPESAEAALCGSADRISGGRPGARVEAAEEYFKRLKKLEKLAYELPGVEEAYAMQAGRELRVIVLPDMIDDKGLIHIARDLKKKIEGELSFHGKIKVSVIREKRAVEYAI